MNALTSQILKEAKSKSEGTVLFPKEFLHLGTRANVDQALSRLVKKGELARVGRGIYTRPIRGRFGKRLPATEKVVKSLSRKTGTPIVPNNVATANSLGLTTQVPTQEVFATSGRELELDLGARKVHIKHAPSWQTAQSDSAAGKALRALAWAGQEHASETAMNLKRHSTPKAWEELLKYRPQLPGWVSTAISQVA